MNNLTVIIPTLNEEKNIGELLEELNSLYPEIHVFVVDDNSQDQTATIVLDKKYKLKAEINVLVRKESPGLTASVLDGILNTTTEYFLVMDGDLQHPCSVVKELYDKLIQDKDLVVGARIPYNENQGIHRIIFTRFATLLAKFYLNLKGSEVKDPMSGFFAGRTEIFKTYANDKARFELAGYKVLFDFLKILKDLRIDNVYYQFRFRKGGKSKLRFAHALYFLRSITKVSWRS